jgi:hypothetical protein
MPFPFTPKLRRQLGNDAKTPVHFFVSRQNSMSPNLPMEYTGRRFAIGYVIGNYVYDFGLIEIQVSYHDGILFRAIYRWQMASTLLGNGNADFWLLVYIGLSQTEYGCGSNFANDIVLDQ